MREGGRERQGRRDREREGGMDKERQREYIFRLLKLITIGWFIYY